MRIVVIGAGHAGIEAAAAASKMGAETTLVTIHFETAGQMSCNPSIGGIAKGHLVKEIDALGGVMPVAADSTGIHFMTLNRSKGPAVRATRSQNDKIGYRNYMKGFLENMPGLKVYQSIVSSIVVKNGKAAGVKFKEGGELLCDAVILTSGTFLNGKIYIGNRTISAGRSNEPPSVELAENIKELGFATRRMKTGTPMRIHSDSINYTKFEEQPGDPDPVPFSLYTGFRVQNRIVCYAGYTTDELKRIIEDNISSSPLYSGKIEGIGPRYCPSVEDKIVKFPHRQRHHIYLEPEGIENKEVYVNGLSTSLPVEVQKKILRSVPGLDNAIIMRPGYAIEYDSIDPKQLYQTLESREIDNLFFAGQVNGTSGYEEAAAQGLLAGINAVLKAKDETPFIPGRDISYMGVMSSDLINTGVDEPYRLFTSRAEYRLMLREDNAFERLGKFGLEFGLVNEKDFTRISKIYEKRKKIITLLNNRRISYKDRNYTLSKLLKIPKMNFDQIVEYAKDLKDFDLKKSDKAYIEAEIKYEGYLERQKLDIKRLRDLEKINLPDRIDYSEVDGLSTEIIEKLSRSRPSNLRKAREIPGVTPAAINALRIYLTIQRKK